MNEKEKEEDKHKGEEIYLSLLKTDRRNQVSAGWGHCYMITGLDFAV